MRIKKDSFQCLMVIQKYSIQVQEQELMYFKIQ